MDLIEKKTSLVTKMENKLRHIDNLDFTLLKLKLKDIDDGEGWEESYCCEIEILYKRFLKLILFYPSENFVPTKEVDTFWHYHILDTHSYVAATNDIFGYYLHHYPYLGLFPEDQQRLGDLFLNTKALYQETFNEPFPESLLPTNEVVGCKSNCAGRCRN